jgi:hypothetical protein
MTGTWTKPGYYAASIRQDTAARKVYIVPRNQTSEQLLYDFNMQVGDIFMGICFFILLREHCTIN